MPEFRVARFERDRVPALMDAFRPGQPGHLCDVRAAAGGSSAVEQFNGALQLTRALGAACVAAHRLRLRAADASIAMNARTRNDNCVYRMSFSPDASVFVGAAQAAMLLPL